MSRTLNQIIKDMAYERKVDYKPREHDLPPQDCYEYGFVQGAKWFNNQIRMWQIKVFDDHETYNGPRIYTVPATSGRDAQLMAFILDRGIGDDKYGHSGTVELGELELARMHTEIISSDATGIWTEFKSGPNSKMPVSADTIVEVQYNSCEGCTTTAGKLFWVLEPHLPVAIVRYRVVNNG